MDIKKEILRDLGLDCLIDSPFEEAMTVKEMKSMEEIVDINYYERGALYMYSGFLHCNIYSSEGKEIHKYLEKGSLTGVSESLVHVPEEEDHPYSLDYKAITDSVIVFLPFKDIIDGDYPKETWRKLFELIAKVRISDTNLIISRMVYSDEEFLLKALEHEGTFKLSTTELAKALNMGLRNLQRYLKNYSQLGIIEKGRKRITVKDMDKLKKYMDEILG